MSTLRGVRGNKIAMIFQEPMVSLNPCIPWKNSSMKCCPAPGMRKEAARAKS
jgi:microcin C transport system ATP-binding protein